MAIVLPKLSRHRPSAWRAPSAPPALSLTLDRDDARYRVGWPLKARWRIGRAPVRPLAGLEASVLWYTEGKGEEDLHVHHFQRWNEHQLRDLDPRDAMTLQCELPYSPLSYEGTLLRIRWCVRLRLFCSTGPETVVQTPFKLVHDASEPAVPLTAAPLTADEKRLPAAPTASPTATPRARGPARDAGADDAPRS